MSKPTVEWSAAQREEAARQYERIGYVPGELWPAPREGTSVEECLAILRSVPDGAGRAGYTSALARFASGKKDPGRS